MTHPLHGAGRAALRRFLVRRFLFPLGVCLVATGLLPAQPFLQQLDPGPRPPAAKPADAPAQSQPPQSQEPQTQQGQSQSPSEQPQAVPDQPAEGPSAQSSGESPDGTGDAESALPTKEELQRRIEQIPAPAEGESPSEARQLLQAALALADERDAAVQQQQKWQQDLADRDENEREYQTLLQQPPPTPKSVPEGLALSTAPLESFQDLPVAEVTQEVQKAEQARNYAAERLAMFEARPKQREARRAAIPKEIAEARQGIQAIDNELAEPAAAAPNVAEARDLKLQFERAALVEKIDALTLEQQVKSTGDPLNKLQQETTKRDLDYLRQRHEALLALANRKRQAEAGARVAEARRQAEQSQADTERPDEVNALLKSIADQNVAYAEKSQELANEIATLQQETSSVTEDTAEITDEFATSKERVGLAGGPSQASGKMLRQQLMTLPETGELRRRMSALETKQQSAMFEQFENIDRHTDLLELEDDVNEALAGLSVSQPERWRDDVRALLETQRENLNTLNENYSQYVESVSALTIDLGKLVTVTDEFNDFITERVLWIRSADTLLAYNAPSQEILDVRYGARALRWTFDPQHWRSALRAMSDSFRASPVRIGLLAAMFALVIGAQDRMRKRLRESGEAASSKTCAEMRPTVEAVLRTAVIALPWPLLVWTFGWMMEAGAGADEEFVRSLGVGLRVTAYCYLFIEVVRHICRRGGLAEKHFDWPETSVRQVRNYSGLLGIAALPLILWTTGLEAQNYVVEFSTSLGRVAFMAAMLVISFVLYRVFISSGSPLRRLLSQGGQADRIELDKVWRPLLVAAPAALAVLAATGYYYTAQWLAVQGIKTAVLVVALLTIGGLIRRWLLVNRRRLAREQARQRRAQLAAIAEAEGAPPPAELVEDAVDFAALSQQTEKLMSTLLLVAGLIGAYRIWHDLVPAIAHLGAVTLIPIEGNPITWSMLLASAIALLVTYVCVRDVPALLELVVLQRLPLDSGARYAISTMCRYVLIAVGVVIALAVLQLPLDQLGWLVAALGVGLGFGLQEIVANFVSGIILLFERPIRVGDIITLGDTTGVVTRIRIRATAITDWDRKEYLVPNKDLVTGRLLNWTLTDLTNRVVINVGVAYGSNTERACELLLEVCRDHPIVLEDPAPIATFEAFGDSTLNLVLRCYLPNIEHRLRTIHELHTEIDKRFKAEGLEIAFPQLDLHVRSAPEFVYSDRGGHAGNGAQRASIPDASSGGP